MIKVIPSLEIIEGKCVRLSGGDFGKKVFYDHDPVDVALRFEDHGSNRLHIVDLDGVKDGAVKNYKALEKIAGKVKMKIDFGGGIQTDEDARVVLESGAQMISIGSVAVNNKKLYHSWINRFGAEKVLLGADVRNEKVTVKGWTEDSGVYIYEFIHEHLEAGTKYIFCTDVSKDGSLEGPSTSLYYSILKEFPDLHLIASGGVSSIRDIEDLDKVGCKEVIIGKALYENRITLDDLRRLNSFA